MARHYDYNQLIQGVAFVGILIFIYLIMAQFNTYKEMFVAEISKKPNTTMEVKVYEPEVNLDRNCPLQ